MDVKNDIMNPTITGIAGKIWISDTGKYIGHIPNCSEELKEPGILTVVIPLMCPAGTLFSEAKEYSARYLA
jgi:hypothetical protein